MGNPQTIWNHEKKQAEEIARALVGTNNSPRGWRRAVVPVLLLRYFRWRNKMKLTQKNLLFTKLLAFGAAAAIAGGKDRSLEWGAVETKTRNVLSTDNQGFYSEKIRRKQLLEIALFVDHYLRLFKSSKRDYAEMIRETYRTRAEYRSFLDMLGKAETEVIGAASSTMRKGSKKDRYQWFKRVQEVTWETRAAELDRLFPETNGSTARGR